MAASARFVVVALAGFAAAGLPQPAPAQDVTIYRCVDARGHLTLRDTPCGKDQKQEQRTMQRPQDAPRRAPATSDAEPVADESYDERYDAPAEREVYITPPRPLYECITPDGMRYTSDTGEGNPRYVPLWTLGYPQYSFGGMNVGPNYVGAYGNAQTFVQDTCYQLPPAEVCDRTRDRRDEIRRRFFNAMPTERDVLRVEERSLNARLDNDCDGH
jgi:hypothetical protein